MAYAAYQGRKKFVKKKTRKFDKTGYYFMVNHL